MNPNRQSHVRYTDYVVLYIGRLPMGSARRRKGNSLVAVFSSALSGPGVTISDKDDVRRQAVMDVIQIWMDRLQLVSVIVSTVLPLVTILPNACV